MILKIRKNIIDQKILRRTSKEVMISMGTTFPKDILDCMKGCILSIFWFQKDIVDFMKKVGCTTMELINPRK